MRILSQFNALIYLFVLLFLSLKKSHQFTTLSETGSNLIKEFLEDPQQIMKDVDKLESVAKFVAVALNPGQNQEDAKEKEAEQKSKVSNKKNGLTKINTNMIVKKKIYVENSTILKDSLIQGNLNVLNDLNSQYLNSKIISAQKFQAESIYNDRGGIILEGDLVIGKISTEKPFFIKNANSFLVQNTRQWSLVDHENFDQQEKETQWSFKETNNCNDQLPNYFLGGHCKLSSEEIQRRFKNLPKHSMVRIKATFHMFDNWQGELAYMKLNDQKIWVKKGLQSSLNQSSNRCGNSKYADPLMNIVIDKTIQNADSEFTLKFGTDLNQNPCEASYGIDDVSIYTK